MKYIAKIDDQEFTIDIGLNNQIEVNGEPYEINYQKVVGSGVTSLILDKKSLEAVVEEQDGRWDVLIRGELYPVQVADERSYRLAHARGTFGEQDGEALIDSPMPGIIIAVPVSEGDTVVKGQKVIILESMKMENELRAPRDGVVTQVKVTAGASVEKGQTLMVISDPQE